MKDPSDAFEKGAQAVGLDGVSFRACLDSDRHADVIAANQELARRFGIRSTPTTVIGHRSGEVRELRRDSYRSLVRAIGEVERGGPAD